MTSEIQQNRYDRLVRRVAGIIGPGSKVSEVLTELFPMLDVEGERGELQLLSGAILAMGAHTLAGTGDKRARVQLFNPVNSGLLITVTDIAVASTIKQNIRIGRGTIVAASGVATQVARDTRQLVTNFPTGQIFSDDVVAAVDANIILRVAADEGFMLSPKNDVMILAPGNGCSVGADIINSQIVVTFFWRERPAESSELNF